VKGVGDREILETYLNSASKNTSETDIFPHGTKSLLTSVICTSGFDLDIAAPRKQITQNTVKVIKSSRLRWAGHVVRMDDNELPK
jgi:hypothetical protein